jgi:hypothetical protein
MSNVFKQNSKILLVTLLLLSSAITLQPVTYTYNATNDTAGNKPVTAASPPALHRQQQQLAADPLQPTSALDAQPATAALATLLHKQQLLTSTLPVQLLTSTLQCTGALQTKAQQWHC